MQKQKIKQRLKRKREPAGTLTCSFQKRIVLLNHQKINPDMQTETLASLYRSYTGSLPEQVEELPGAGSNRRYFRMKGPQTLIGVIGTSNEENHAFLTIDRHFKEKNLPVPEVYAATEDESCYLQEDLGDLQLFKAIEKGRLTGVFSEEEKELLRKTLRMLPRIQFAGADGLDFSVCYPQPEFNRRTICGT